MLQQHKQLFWTNLQATITPTRSDSKILVMANQNFNITDTDVTQLQFNFFICNSSGTILQGQRVVLILLIKID